MCETNDGDAFFSRLSTIQFKNNAFKNKISVKRD